MNEIILVVLWAMGSAAAILAGAVLAFKSGIPAILYAGMVLVAALEGFSLFIGVVTGVTYGWMTGVLVGLSVGFIFYSMVDTLVMSLLGASIGEELLRSARRRPH